MFAALATTLTFLALAIAGERDLNVYRAVGVLGIGCTATALLSVVAGGRVLRIGITAVALVALLLELVFIPTTGTHPTALIVISSIVCFGFAIDAVLNGLSTIAAAEDEIATAKVHELAQSEGKEFERREAFRISRALHDRAANTLHAAALAPANSEQLRQRCRHDLLLMQAGTVSTHTSLTDLFRAAKDHAKRLGVRLHLDPTNDLPLSAVTYEHLDSIITESLTNIAKYVPDRTAHLRLEQHAATTVITIEDGGRGWRTDAPRATGHGTSNAFATQVHNSGVTVAYSNRLGGGLTVTIELDAARETETTEFQAGFTMTELATVPMARGIAFWMLGLCLMVMVVTWQQLPSWWWIVLAGIGTGCVMTLINWSARRELPAAATAAAALSATAVLGFAASAASTSQAWSWLACLPAGLIVIVATWLAGKPHSWWPIAGYTAGIAILFANLSGRENLAVAILAWLVVSTAAAGMRLLNRRVGEYDQLINTSLADLAQLRTREATEASRARARDLILQRCLSEVGPIFDDIQSEDSNPAEPGLNRRIQACERLLRNAIALGADLSPLSAQLLRLLWRCHVAGIGIEVNISNAPTTPREQQVAQFGDYLEKLLDTAPVEQIGVTSYLLEDGGGLFASITLAETRHEVPAAPTGIVTTFDPPNLVIVELEWQQSPDSSTLVSTDG